MHGGYISLAYGVLTVGGDIWSDGSISATASNGSKVVLNGSGTQDVYLSNGSMFSELEVTNPSKRTIVWNGNLNICKLASDINIETDDLNLINLDLDQHNMVINNDCDMTYDGSVSSLRSSGVNLNGGLLTINGGFFYTCGTITCNNGTLNVNGDCTMFDSTIMNSQYDKINITGNLKISNFNGSKGVLSVGGDIWSNDSSNIFGLEHRTILTGNTKQSVTLVPRSKFGILVLTQPKSNYTFKYDNCWNTLNTVEAGSGDVDGDGKLTVADVVLLQKWLLAVPNTHLPCWKAVDMYDDNKLDVFDLCILKYKLINS